MNDAQVLELLTGALGMAAKIAGPLLITALVLGVVVSILQTVTQIQEMTLSFVPKLVGMALVLVFGGTWMLRELVTWMDQLWTSIPSLVG